MLGREGEVEQIAVDRLVDARVAAAVRRVAVALERQQPAGLQLARERLRPTRTASRDRRSYRPPGSAARRARAPGARARWRGPASTCTATRARPSSRRNAVRPARRGSRAAVRRRGSPARARRATGRVQRRGLGGVPSVGLPVGVLVGERQQLVADAARRLGQRRAEPGESRVSAVQRARNTDVELSRSELARARPRHPRGRAQR